MSDKKKDKDILSVANSIKGWALINIQDIFAFMITATDEEIIERYGSEKTAVDIAEKYLDIAKTVDLIEYPIRGWSFVYTQPLMDGERKDHTARFYDVKEGELG